MPPFWIVGRQLRARRSEKEKIYRGIIWREESRIASSLASLKSKLTRRTRRCAEAQGLVVVDSQRVVLHPAARWVTTLH